MTEPCMFTPPHEPFYCRIHADVRLRLTDERCRRGVTLTQPRLTHGRHCPCGACRRQDWAEPGLAPCGMHGPSCPPVYAPLTLTQSQPHAALREAAQPFLDAALNVFPEEWISPGSSYAIAITVRGSEVDALRAALRSTPAAPLEADRDCGAYHPDHPGTRCRRKPGHAGEHATARYDVTWDNAYLSGPEADHA